jgi:hypothetical protein
MLYGFVSHGPLMSCFIHGLAESYAYELSDLVLGSVGGGPEPISLDIYE